MVFIAPAGSSVGSEEVYRAPPLALFGSLDVGVRFR
jgi:hypothetical protein